MSTFVYIIVILMQARSGILVKKQAFLFLGIIFLAFLFLGKRKACLFLGISLPLSKNKLSSF